MHLERLTNRHTACGKCDSPGLFEIPPTPADHSHIVVVDRLMHNVPVTRYVCTDCGYIEEWVNEVRDLERLRAELGRAKPVLL